MTLESKENYPRHTKIVQNSLGFMPEVKPLHKPRGDLVLCAHHDSHMALPHTSDMTCREDSEKVSHTEARLIYALFIRRVRSTST